GVLVGLGADDSQAQARNAAFLQGLGERGWIVGRNLQIDFRWGGGNARRYRRHAAELVALAPELIVAMGGSVVGPLLQTTRTVPVVFLQVTDPVNSGYVASLARPGGNATGFALFESASARNGSNFSKRSRHASRGQPSFAIPRCPLVLVN